MERNDDSYRWEGARIRLYAIALVAILVFVCSGCGDFVIGKRTVLQEGGEIPQEKELSFKSKEALAAGATLQNVTAAQVYYEGAEPKSKEAKLLYDLSYRFLGLVGINMDFDPGDPASIQKVFEKADNALKERDKNLHDLKEQLKQEQKAREVAEKERKGFAARVWGAVWAILGAILGILVILALIEVFTGIPTISWILPWIQKRIRKTAHQTMKGVQVVRKELENDIENGSSNEEKLILRRVLARINATLDDHQDQEVKQYIKAKKAKGL